MIAPHRDAFFTIMQQRHSVRAYLGNCAPDRAQIERLLTAARLAPSGANLQPGHFHVLTGEPLTTLSAALLSAHERGDSQPEDYSYFPKPMPSDLKARQKAAGYALYQALGVARRDIAGRRAQFARNYRFFDAPVGIIMTLDARLGAGCYMDFGMALYGLLLAAEADGLSTCGIGALASYPHVIREELGLGPEHAVLCGMALGYKDPAAPVNQFRTAREPLATYSTFHGF